MNVSKINISYRHFLVAGQIYFIRENLYYIYNFYNILAEGISSDDIFGIHTELKLPPEKHQSHLVPGEDDNAELESISGE